MPKGAYNGQKEMKEVSTKMAAKTKSTMPNTPVRVPVKYKAAMTMAISMRTVLSVLPMFFFMMLVD